MSLNNFDYTSIVEEGYVLRIPNGEYLIFEERRNQTSRHGVKVHIREGRLINATIFASKMGPLNTPGIQALEQYEGVTNHHITYVHVTRTSLVSVSVDPVKRGEASSPR